MTRYLLFAGLLLAACHERRPPAPNAQQSDQLNEAETMLNGMADNQEQNEKGPADRSASPSNQSN